VASKRSGMLTISMQYKQSLQDYASRMHNSRSDEAKVAQSSSPKQGAKKKAGGGGLL
jgi:hypothetical protein